MGEYANYKGESVKIGTCESMYYLRADQRHLVTALPGNVDPVKDALDIRFRFPFPDEDTLEPGNFDDYSRGYLVEGVTPPTNDHGMIQFSAKGEGKWPATYLVSLPCPLSDKATDGPKIHRNGGVVGVLIRQQKLQANGEIWTVVACSACGAAWRSDRESAEELVVALRSKADRQHTDAAGNRDYYYPQAEREMMHEIANRVMAGYSSAVLEMAAND